MSERAGEPLTRGAWSELRDTVMSDPERAARVEQIKEQVMAEQERPWCIVPDCNEEVTAEQEVVLRVVGGEFAPVWVPFCRAHGITVGSDV